MSVGDRAKSQAKHQAKKQALKALQKVAVKTIGALVGKWVAIGLAILAVIALFVAFILFWSVNQEAVAGACGTNLGLSTAGGAYVPNAAGTYGPNPTVVNIAYAVGKQMNASDNAILALFVAIDAESGFKNLANDGVTHGGEDGGSKPVDLAEAGNTKNMPHDAWTASSEFGTDHASAGILQQQVGPSFDWGSAAEVMDPAHAAGVFLTRLMSGPEAQYPNNIPMMVQSVQRSAFSNGSNYAKLVPAATDIFNQAKTAAAGGGGGQLINTSGGVTCNGAGGNVLVTNGVASLTNSNSGEYAGQQFNIALPVGEAGQAILIALGEVQKGTPYSWGGGTVNGPSTGIQQGAGTVGFDCSSFVRYSIYQGTGGRVTIPRVSGDQYAALPHIGSPAPGDLSFYDPPSGSRHVVMYLGKYTKGPDGVWVADNNGTNLIVEEAHTGAPARISALPQGSQLFGHPDYQGSVPVGTTA